MEKTIWVINYFAGTPESGWGERHFYFSKYWIKQGYQIRIISGSFNHLFKKTTEVIGLYKHEIYEGVDFYWVKTPKYRAISIWRFYSMLVFMVKVFFLSVKKLGKPNVVIVSSMPIFPILNGYYLKKKFGAKLLFEIRDIWPLTLEQLGNKSKNHPAVRFIGWFEKFGYLKADTIVSLLPYARKHIEGVAGKAVNFQYIPNGIDPKEIGYEKIPSKLESKIPKNKFIIGYAGSIGMANALEYLVEASIQLERKNKIFFVIVGDGPLKKDLEEKVQEGRNILFYSKIKKSQVQNLISHFDVCFVGRNDIPLFKHGVSANKYFDYMLSGKPILDSNNNIKDPVELSECGLIVEPDSTATIIDGILKIKSLSEDKRRSMGEMGKRFVIKYHSIANLAKDYANLFK